MANGRLPEWAHLNFIEPRLSFEFVARDRDGIRFAVHLRAELRPKFKLRQLSTSTKEWPVVFHFDSERLSAVALAAEAALATFPIRSARE